MHLCLFEGCTKAAATSKIYTVSSAAIDSLSELQTFTWVKADLHIHTSEDPMDEIDYCARELVERAQSLDFRVLAVTLHDKVFDDPEVFARAEMLGVLLIPAAELRIEGADVVVLNLTREEAENLNSFDDLRTLRAVRGDTLLTFAPHPFYRAGGSIGPRIHQYLDCFDAIEHCHFHVPFLNPNKQAADLARRTGKPLLATSDTHRWKFFGQNYSKIGLASNPETLPTMQAVFSAIRANHLQLVTPTGGWSRFIALLAFLFIVHPILTSLPGSKRMRAQRGQVKRVKENPCSDKREQAVA